MYTDDSILSNTCHYVKEAFYHNVNVRHSVMIRFLMESIFAVFDFNTKFKVISLFPFVWSRPDGMHNAMTSDSFVLNTKLKLMFFELLLYRYLSCNVSSFCHWRRSSWCLYTSFARRNILLDLSKFSKLPVEASFKVFWADRFGISWLTHDFYIDVFNY